MRAAQVLQSQALTGFHVTRCDALRQLSEAEGVSINFTKEKWDR